MLLMYLFLLFTVGPLVELMLLVYVGQNVLGWLPTIGLVILTGIVGAALARSQGAKALMRVQRRISRGQVPTDELFDGVLILIAGCLLVTPGMITDLAGFSLLVPPARSVIKRALRSWAKKNIEVRTTRTKQQFWSTPGDASYRDEIIDAEVIETRVVE